MKNTDEKIKEIRSKLELYLCDLDMDLTYLKHGVIPYNEDRNFRDIFIDKDLIFKK